MNLKDAFGDFDRRGEMANAKIVTRQDQLVAEMIDAIMANSDPESVMRWPAIEKLLTQQKTDGEEPIDRVIAAFALIGFLEVFKRLWEDSDEHE